MFNLLESRQLLRKTIIVEEMIGAVERKGMFVR